jgi:hypothetical protein
MKFGVIKSTSYAWDKRPNFTLVGISETQVPYKEKNSTKHFSFLSFVYYLVILFVSLCSVIIFKFKITVDHIIGVWKINISLGEVFEFSLHCAGYCCIHKRKPKIKSTNEFTFILHLYSQTQQSVLIDCMIQWSL